MTNAKPTTLPRLEQDLAELRRIAESSPKLTVRSFYREDGDRLVLDYDGVDEYYEERRP